MHFTARKVAASGLVLGLLISATPAFSHTSVAAKSANASGTNVAFLFSDFTTSARYTYDRDFFKQALAISDPVIKVLVYDAKASQSTQQNNAQAALTTGVKAIILDPVDSVGAGAIVKLAHQENPPVPVLSYDRLVLQAPVDAYISFDNFNVGVQQANYLVKNVAKGGTLVLIGGSPTDNNATLFMNGALSVLTPLFKNGTYKLGYQKFTPNWDPTLGNQEMAAALTLLKNKVDGVLSANDGLAGGIVQALKAQGLAGKVPVTGQDATIAGIQQILLGNQSMTIYKPIRKIAAGAAQIVSSLVATGKYESKITVDNKLTKVPSILLPVTTVDKSNIATTVIADGFVTKAQLCKGIAAACKAAGL